MLVALPIRHYRLLPDDCRAYAWIDLAEIAPGHWTAGYGTGLRRSPVGAGRSVEHNPDGWPNAHNAWFAQLRRIDAFWRQVPADLAPEGVREWIDWLGTEDFEGLFAPMRITFSH